MMTAKIGLVVIIVLLFHCGNSAQENGNSSRQYIPCQIDGKPVYTLDYFGLRGKKIDDNYGQRLVTTFSTSGIDEFSTNSSKWLTMKYDKREQILSVFTTRYFKDYDEHEIGTWIEVNMLIKCENGEHHKIPYRQEINDLNSFPPVWNKDEYVFEMYGTLCANARLTNFIEMSVNDKDCSPDVVSFEIASLEPDKKVEEFYLSSDKTEGKTTLAKLFAREDIHPPFETQYVLKVKDRQDEDAKESTAMLTVRLLASETNFRFIQKSFSVQVVHDKVVSTDAIRLEEGLDHDINVVIEESEYSEYFRAVLNHVTGKIELVLNEPLPNALQRRYAHIKNFSLTLKARWQNREASAIVHVTSDKDLEVICHVPVIDIKQKSFENPDYLEDTFEGTIFNVSGIKNVEAMDCEGSEYLKCVFEKRNGEFKVITTDKFKHYEDVETKTSITMMLRIQCLSDTKTLEFKQRIYDTNNHTPKFSKDQYAFTFYNEISNMVEITMLNTISASDIDLTTTKCNFQLVDDEKHFKIKHGSSILTDKVCKARIAAVDHIQAPFDKTFQLVVEDDGSPKLNSSTVIRVQVIKDHVDEVMFTQPEYFMTLHSNTTTLEVFDGYERPALVNGIDSDTQFYIQDTAFANKIRVNANKLTGNVELALVENVLLCKNCDTLSFDIRATWKGLEAVSRVTLVMRGDYIPPAITKPTPSNGIDQNGELESLASFVMSSLISVMMMFVTLTVLMCVLIYLLVRRFLIVRRPKPTSVSRINLPEKLPI